MSIRSRFTNEYWITSGFLTILKNVSNILLSFGGFYFLVRLLDKNSFGIWSLFLGTTTLLELSRNGLVSNAFLKYLASATKEDYPRIIRASFTVTGILTLIGVVISLSIAGWLGRVWNSPEVAALFYLYTIVFVLTGFINQFNCIQQANLKYNGIFKSSLCGSAFSFCYIVVAYYSKTGISLLALMYVQIAGAALALLIAYIYTKPFIQVSRKLDRQWVKTILGYGKFAFGTGLSAMIFTNIDQWMLGYLITPAAAGVYNIAVRITNIAEIPIGTIATIVFPQSARRSAIDGLPAARYLYEKSVGVILALLLPGLFMLYCCSGIFVPFIAGDKYADAVHILHITILYSLFVPFSRQSGTILDSIGRPQVNFYIVLLSAVTNVCFNYVFIRQFGIPGAAYGTFAASVVNFIFCRITLHRILGVSFLQILRYTCSFYPELIRKYVRSGKSKPALAIQGEEPSIPGQ